MSIEEQELIERIKNNYEAKPKEISKLEELKVLDKRVKMPTRLFSYIYGIIGALILGSGMCLAMKVLFASINYAMYIGVGVGVLGIVMVSTTYSIYKCILAKRKAKYSKEIIAKSNDLLNKKEGE